MLLEASEVVEGVGDERDRAGEQAAMPLARHK